jgi:hypothetical protein
MGVLVQTGAGRGTRYQLKPEPRDLRPLAQT